MSGFESGAMALVKGADTPEGRELLVGKEVVLVQRFEEGFHEIAIKGQPISLYANEVSWIVDVRDYPNGLLGIPDLEFIKQRHLILLKDPNNSELFSEEASEQFEEEVAAAAALRSVKVQQWEDY